MNNRSPSVPIPSATAAGCHDALHGLDLGSTGADRTAPVAAAVTNQDIVLASLKTRLTKEVVTLAEAIHNFGLRTGVIGEELSDIAKLDEIDVRYASLIALQVSNLFLQVANGPALFGEGVNLIDQLRLHSKQLLSEFVLNGDRFLVIALGDQSLAKVNDR